MKKEGEEPQRILIYDLEVSPNIGFFWQTGNRLSIGPDSIIHERAIICIAYKWLGEEKVHCIKWNKGNDKELCKKFAKVIEQSTHTIAHNGDNFDQKWFMARCIFHGINTSKFTYRKIDTLKIARRLFRFNSNKLDYIGKYLGLGQKKDTGGFQTWKDIVLRNSTKAMSTMVYYCKGDVELLEKVYNKLNKYLPKKK